MMIQGVLESTRLLSYVMGQVYGVSEYSWSDDFCKEQIKSTLQSMRNSIARLDFDQLTAEEAIAIGFTKFGSEQDNEYLVPVWMISALPEGTVLTSILGKKVVVGTDTIDDDHRGGMSAYMMDFKPSSTEPKIDFVPRPDEEE